MGEGGGVKRFDGGRGGVRRFDGGRRKEEV